MADKDSGTDACYPQRPAVPKTSQEEPKVREHAGPEACKKQYGECGRN